MSQPTGLHPLPGVPPPSPTPRKRKHRPWMPQKKARRRMKEYAGHASEILQEVLAIVAEISSDAGVPGLSSGLEALLTILEKIQAMKTNVEGVAALAIRITALKDALEKLLLQHQELADDMKERIDTLCKLWERIAADAQHIKCRGIIKRFFTSNVDATKLQGLVQEVNQSIEDFLLQAMLSIEANVHVVRQDVKATQLDVSFLSTYAKNAQYDSVAVRRGCLKGTRKGVLTDVDEWFLKSSSEPVSTDPQTTPQRPGHVLWINGLAGTGKTTVAYSITEKYKKERKLGANFFCSRSDAECSDPKFIFVTIARQLCLYHVPYQERVAKILKEDSDVATAGPLRQFEELILRPLRELKGEFPTCVIVIDALDECRDPNITSVILGILARHIKELGSFLFVITSRPEPHITAMFERAHEESLKDATTPLVLHNVHLDSVLDDIRRYLAYGFREIRRAFFIGEEWPSNQDLNTMAERSRGLFIFATTVLRFVGDPDCSNPRMQLRSLLAVSVSVMQDLYREVLRLAYVDVGNLNNINPSLRRVLGAITLAEKSLSVPALSGLLDISESDIRNTLSRLRSVLHIPEEGSEDVIRFIHPTFPEFLLDTSMAKPEAFCILPAEHHLTLLSRSLVAMDSLGRNIAGIERSAAFKSEMPGLSDTVKRCIPAHVAYACSFWSAHLLHCASNTLGQDIHDLLSTFLKGRMLYWLEACSLLGVLDGALATLGTAKRACQILGGQFASLLTLLEDYSDFLWTYHYCIDTSPLQVYHSALALAPTESLVRSLYTQDLDGSLSVRSGALSSWPPRRDVFKGHDGKGVYTIAFSPGGDCFVTGGGDNRVRMRKTSTRAIVQSFEGHTGKIISVATSPDGLHIASGSVDWNVCVWEVSSGNCIQTLVGHRSIVASVVYSADGRRLLSATTETEVKLWDIFDGRCILTLAATGHLTMQVGLSLDGRVIACGNADFLSLYDVSSAMHEALAVPGIVDACTFSPDGRYVAARSEHVLRVWRCADKSLVRSIDMPDSESLLCRLAFSPDGSYVGCASSGVAVYLWNVASDDPPLVLHDYTNVVWDFSWSPNGLQIVSASGDGTIRICDLTAFSTHAERRTASQPIASGPPQFALIRHKGGTVLLHLPSAKVDIAHFAVAALLPESAPTLTLFTDPVDAWHAALPEDLNRITHTRVWGVITGQQHVDLSSHSKQPMRISPDGSLLAYLSQASDEVVEICNLRTGNVVASLVGHTRDVVSIAFSPDSTLIATGSSDNSVKVWKATTGDIVHSHEEHTDWVRALAFSSDGRLIASGSDDASVHVFEAVTGRIERVFEGHRDWVMEVVFVADDKSVLALDDANWVYTWDMETGIRTYEICVRDDSWNRFLTLAPDGTGVLVGESDSEPCPLPICDPGNRTWPAYVISSDGWVYAMSMGHAARLCWVPSEWGMLLSWDGANLCCLIPGQRIFVEIDVSCIPEYVQTWVSSV